MRKNHDETDILKDLEETFSELRLIEKYIDCPNDLNEYDCENCERYKECLDDAEFALDGELTFHDMVVSGGYESEDDFWECNGI